jgi:hypothetical protein
MSFAGTGTSPDKRVILGENSLSSYIQIYYTLIGH